MTEGTDVNHSDDRPTGKLVLSYTVVGVPLIYGLITTGIKAAQLFTG